MDPLVTNAMDPALLRVIEKRGNERENLPARRRSAPAKQAEDRSEELNEEPGDTETPKHELDDLA